MKLHQHAFAPLWPHFGTPVCLHPVQRVYPYKALQAELKGLRLPREARPAEFPLPSDHAHPNYL